ncbi:MAG: hypothetical protein H7061_05865 [Bdellovibrionaceae bacterium]|nr:hypothetical protein [Bdellovibrio sp.]
MKNKWLLALLSLVSIQASAGFTGIYAYEHWFPIFTKDYFKLLEQPSPLEIARERRNEIYDPQVCAPMFAKSFAKGRLDVRYAFGYFDDSRTGEDVLWDGKSVGQSPSLDGETYFALRNALIEPCSGPRVTCGFREIGDPEVGDTTYVKQANILGRSIEIKLRLTHASASSNYIRNKTSLASRQTQMTAQSEDNFFGGLAAADVVFYNGHSRNGGGPDFNPPQLGADGHPNYESYYKAKRPGIKKVVETLKKYPNPGLVYGSFSCFSETHFKAMLLKANPNLRMILSGDTVDYLQSYKGALGYLEGILQGRCGEDLAQFAKRDGLYDDFKGYNFR